MFDFVVIEFKSIFFDFSLSLSGRWYEKNSIFFSWIKKLWPVWMNIIFEDYWLFYSWNLFRPKYWLTNQEKSQIHCSETIECLFCEFTDCEIFIGNILDSGNIIKLKKNCKNTIFNLTSNHIHTQIQLFYVDSSPLWNDVRSKTIWKSANIVYTFDVNCVICDLTWKFNNFPSSLWFYEVF